MSDGTFPSKVSATRADNSSTNPIYITLVDAAGDQIVIDASGFPTVNINGTVTVSATQLDVDDLVAGIGAGEDNVLIFANTVKDGTGTDYVPLVDTDGHLQVDVLSGAGGTEYTEDDAAPANPVGGTVLAERDDALGGLTPAEGDWSHLYVDANGALWVTVNGSVTVTATQLDIDDLDAASDNVAIHDAGGDELAVNTDGSINVNIVSGTIGGEVHDEEEEVDVASDATSNHDYAVTGSTTLLLRSVIIAGSGSFKGVISAGPVAGLVEVATVFSTGRQGDTQQVFFDPPVEVPDTSTGTVRVALTNRQGSAVSIYSTIIGNEV